MLYNFMILGFKTVFLNIYVHMCADIYEHRSELQPKYNGGLLDQSVFSSRSPNLGSPKSQFPDLGIPSPEHWGLPKSQNPQIEGTPNPPKLGSPNPHNLGTGNAV